MRTAAVFLLALFLASQLAFIPSATSEEGASIPRPAIFAVPIGVDARHPEFALEGNTQQALRDVAGVPPALRSHTVEEYVNGPFYMNTFTAAESSKVLGAMHARRMQEPSEQEIEGDSVAVGDHATGVASRIVGETVGSCPNCLLVEFQADLGFAWVAHQSWIDGIVITSGTLLPEYDIYGRSVALDTAIERGIPVFVANGNMMDEGYRYDDTRKAPPTIKVAETDASGRLAVDAPGADLATWGFRAPVARTDGAYESSSGTSLSTPWAAGQYGRWLMEGWSRGAIERVVEDGRVRQKIVDIPGPLPRYAQDGYIDAIDVREMIGSFARANEGYAESVSSMVLYPWYEQDPSYWTGYGVVDDDAWDRMRDVFDEGFPPEPTPEPSHQRHHEIRAKVMERYRWQTKASCLPEEEFPGLRLPVSNCYQWWIDNKGWYQ